MISEREKQILRIIVEEYIKTAKPVSSSHICKNIKCSSATVRNEMVYLEELGYLEKITLHQEEFLVKRDINIMWII